LKPFTEMILTVRLFSSFTKYLPADAERDSFKIETEAGTDLASLMEHLNIPPRMKRVITVNDTNRKENFVPGEGDVVKIFPVAMGG
jgi:hypothetical protein